MRDRCLLGNVTLGGLNAYGQKIILMAVFALSAKTIAKTTSKNKFLWSCTSGL